jgi:hypothetical protein
VEGFTADGYRGADFDGGFGDCDVTLQHFVILSEVKNPILCASWW